MTLYFFVFFSGFDFSIHAMLCFQLADGVRPSFIKRITYLLTYLHPLLYLIRIFIFWKISKISKNIKNIKTIMIFLIFSNFENITIFSNPVPPFALYVSVTKEKRGFDLNIF